MPRTEAQIRAERARNERTIVVQVRLEIEEGEKIDELAAAEGLSRQAWATKVIRKKLGR